MTAFLIGDFGAAPALGTNRVSGMRMSYLAFTPFPRSLSFQLPLPLHLAASLCGAMAATFPMPFLVTRQLSEWKTSPVGFRPGEDKVILYIFSRSRWQHIFVFQIRKAIKPSPLSSPSPGPMIMSKLSGDHNFEGKLPNIRQHLLMLVLLPWSFSSGFEEWCERALLHWLWPLSCWKGHFSICQSISFPEAKA